MTEDEGWRTAPAKVGCRLVGDKPVLLPKATRIIGMKTSHGHSYGVHPVYCLGVLYDRETDQDLGSFGSLPGSRDRRL